MKALDRKTLARFLRLAGDRLEGDWVLVGGALLPLLGVRHRVTIDIDIAGPQDASGEQSLILMEIAEQLGLPVEAINQAAAFFLRRIDGWQEDLILLHRGKGATIYRPNVTLFVILKLGRMSESDLADCLEFIKLGARRGERPDRARIRQAVNKMSRQALSAQKRKRLKALLAALGHER